MLNRLRLSSRLQAKDSGSGDNSSHNSRSVKRTETSSNPKYDPHSKDNKKSSSSTSKHKARAESSSKEKGKSSSSKRSKEKEKEKDGSSSKKSSRHSSSRRKSSTTKHSHELRKGSSSDKSHRHRAASVPLDALPSDSVADKLRARAKSTRIVGGDGTKGGRASVGWALKD